MKKKKVNLKSKIIVILILFISFSACDDTQSNIPTVSVDFIVDLNDPLYNKLRIPGEYEYFTGGYSGILIYHTFDDTYIAFDRACPYDPDCGKLYVDETQFYTVDTVCCKSKFYLLDGGYVANDSEGPATLPMKQYRCIYNEGARILEIKN